MSFGVIVYACQVSYLAHGHTGGNGDGTHVVGRLPADFCPLLLPTILLRWFFLVRSALLRDLRARNAHATKKVLRSDTKGGFLLRPFGFMALLRGNITTLTKKG